MYVTLPLSVSSGEFSCEIQHSVQYFTLPLSLSVSVSPGEFSCQIEHFVCFTLPLSLSLQASSPVRLSTSCASPFPCLCLSRRVFVRDRGLRAGGEPVGDGGPDAKRLKTSCTSPFPCLCPFRRVLLPDRGVRVRHTSALCLFRRVLVRDPAPRVILHASPLSLCLCLCRRVLLPDRGLRVILHPPPLSVSVQASSRARSRTSGRWRSSRCTFFTLPLSLSLCLLRRVLLPDRGVRVRHTSALCLLRRVLVRDPALRVILHPLPPLSLSLSLQASSPARSRTSGRWRTGR